jgi:hypothetical protein
VRANFGSVNAPPEICNETFLIGRPPAVVTLPLIAAFAAVGASGVKFQNPEVILNGNPLIRFPVAVCPIVPSIENVPPDCPRFLQKPKSAVR